jgi:hypothetical protein
MTINKQILKEQLATGPVVVTFTKKDGTERIMPCTTNQTIIMFKSGGGLEESTDNGSTVTVYDLEIDGWRSFRWDSVKSAVMV